MTRTPDSADIASILAAAESPCVSIYLPTPSGAGGPTASAAYRALADRAAEALARSYPQVAPDLTAKLRALEADGDFWAHALQGVAVLASPARFDALTLHRAVPERADVGDTFHVKPLRRYVQSAEPFHVLALSRERVGLFRGNRYVLTPLTPPGVQLNISESLGSASDVPTPGLHAAGPEAVTRPDARVGGEDSHGHLVGSGQAVRKIHAHPDAERFFREVDRQVIARVSEPSQLPVILAGIEENLALFRGLTKNRFVLPDAVHGDWAHWNLHEIREAAWKAFGVHYLARLARVREDFGTACARGRGTGDLGAAARAAAVGRVGMLLIDDHRTAPGSLDLATGALNPSADGSGDMLDDLAEMALKTSATVVVTPSAQMPTDTGLAAIFRY